MKFENILITGGAGYCGSVIVPLLLSKGHNVTVFDMMFFGSLHLPRNNRKLNLIKGDIRDINSVKRALNGIDAVLHLACISNDVSFELDEKLSTSINYEAFEPLVIASKDAGVKRFIYASSSSVYGVSDQPNVTEDHPLVPLTLYNKYKGMCEPLLKKHTDDEFIGVTFRPATVCGYAPRQRLDLSVNILTNLAVRNNIITVFGGEQLRPNLHVNDYADLCDALLNADDNLIADEIFNCGYENKTIMDIACDVQKIVSNRYPNRDKVTLKVSENDDKRSYHINSDKIFQKLGFAPKLSINDAVNGLCNAFSEGLLPESLENDNYFNLKIMKKFNTE
jgi:nucleoside-diphosphate-sugar epimerase